MLTSFFLFPFCFNKPVPLFSLLSFCFLLSCWVSLAAHMVKNLPYYCHLLSSNYHCLQSCPTTHWYILFSMCPVKLLSRVRLFATPWTVAYQAPQSIEFSMQEYWSGLPFPSPGDLPNPGIEPRSPPGLPHCRQTLYHLSHQGSPLFSIVRAIYPLSHVTFLFPILCYVKINI